MSRALPSGGAPRRSTAPPCGSAGRRLHAAPPRPLAVGHAPTARPWCPPAMSEEKPRVRRGQEREEPAEGGTGGRARSRLSARLPRCPCRGGRERGRPRDAGSERGPGIHPARTLSPPDPAVFHPGWREHGERAHRGESCRAGRLRGAVQNKAAHPAEQADGGVLLPTGGRGLGPGAPTAPKGSATPARPTARGSLPVLVEASPLLCQHRGTALWAA